MIASDRPSNPADQARQAELRAASEDHVDGEGREHVHESRRKQWVEDRIEELAQIFAVGVGGFSVMDNHLHVLVRLDPDTATGWSDEEVVRRWGRLFPPRDKSRRPLAVSDDWVQ